MKRNPFKGFIRTWFFDVGSVNFLGTGLVMAIVAVLFPKNADEAGFLFALMYGLTVVSTYIAIAWQVIRLRATEWQTLTYGFQRHIQIQALTLYILIPLVGCLYGGYAFGEKSVTAIIAATILGNLFLIICRFRPNYFHIAVLIYVLNITTQAIAELVSLTILASVLAITTLFVINIHMKLNWTEKALHVFKAGINSGWMMSPNFTFKWLTAFERYLFPANFFIGPTLSSTMILLPILFIVTEGLSIYFGWKFPVLLILLQISVVISAMIHWGRLQRPQALDMLLTLPIHDGMKDLRTKFAKGQRRVANIIGSYVLCLAIFAGYFSDTFSLNAILHITMTCYGANLLMMGFAGFAKRMWQFTLAMFPVMLIGIWVVTGQEYIADDPTTVIPLLVNSMVLIVAETVFRYSSKRMWN